MSEKKRPVEQDAIINRVKRETKDTSTLYLQLPDRFEWKPGQFIMVSAEIDHQNIRRAYSIASSPTRLQYLEITVRQTENPTMSKYLNEITEGQLLSVRGPYGKFIWTEEVNSNVFMLAAGSGITPFKAFIEYMKDRSLHVKSKLLYSCPFSENVIFNDYLNDLTKNISGCQYELSLTREQSPHYPGRRGRIDKNYLSDQIKGFEDSHYYICGAPGFIDTMINILHELGINMDRIKREQWG